MIKTVIKDNFAFLYLNKEFYDKEPILISLKEFNEIIKSEVSQVGKYYIIKISLINNKFKIEQIINEITNYIMGEEYIYLNSRK